MWLPFLIAALPIAFADVKTFTIPNVYLWWLAVLCSPILILRGFGPIANLVAIGVILTSLSLVGLGMGDVKLISIILLFSNSDVQASLILLAFFMLVSASCYVILKTLWDRKLPRRIPLAPSIFMGLGLYLATS